MPQPSNEERLRKAQVIHSETKLSAEQQAAINELSLAEVDQLIALNAKLVERIPSARGRAIVEVIGRNGKKQMDDHRGFLSSLLNWLKRLFRG
jgi:hypothetical protein